ncbi:hypothetical protein ASZ78_007936, partial [Callipepla squamata]
DPDRLIQCPYDNHHRIRARRFPYHLVKCRKNHPEVEKLLATCPFNARHLVPKADLGDHILKCKDKRLIEQDIARCSSGSQRDEMNVVSTWKAPPCDEDWEKGGYFFLPCSAAFSQVLSSISAWDAVIPEMPFT